MGADGAATLSTIIGQGTVQQPVKKIQKLADKMMIGVSGSVGLAQRISGVLGQHQTISKLSSAKSFQAMQILRQELAPVLVPELKYAKDAMPVLGNAGVQFAVTQTLLAASIEGRVRLYSFGCTGEPEEMTEALPFVAIGSGQNLGDPFLAFLRSVFWKDTPPSIADGVFATYWSLSHAIRRNTGGVADPKQIMTAQRNKDGQVSIRELEPEELEETDQAVKSAELHLSKFDFRNAEGEPPPAAPAE
jgi:20S proteasome alpha/beta subunit